MVAGYNCYTPPSLLDPMERREGREKKMSHLQVIMSLATLLEAAASSGIEPATHLLVIVVGTGDWPPL